MKCSFCGRTQLEAQRLVAGAAGTLICDACVRALAEELAPEWLVRLHVIDRAARLGVREVRLLLELVEGADPSRLDPAAAESLARLRAVALAFLQDLGPGSWAR